MQNWTDIYFTSRDGLRLYARHYPVPGSLRRPLVCLAGLSRNSRDFHDLATVLARPDETGRDVYTIAAPALWLSATRCTPITAANRGLMRAMSSSF